MAWGDVCLSIMNTSSTSCQLGYIMAWGDVVLEHYEYILYFLPVRLHHGLRGCVLEHYEYILYFLPVRLHHGLRGCCARAL